MKNHLNENQFMRTNAYERQMDVVHVYTAPTTFFDFEEDFVENGIRCIPMIVRFKMDAAGIKLKLAEWTKFSVGEKEQLAKRSCDTQVETMFYRTYLQQLIRKNTGNQATELNIDHNPPWAKLEKVNEEVKNNAIRFGWKISAQQWQHLTNLQRFALLKLCRPGHEQRNFPKAMREFNLVNII